MMAKMWLAEENGAQVFRIFGFAGTGKTTLAKEIAGNVDGDVCYGAFTGKAASVMRRKGCADASTIHGLIYKLEDEGEGQEPKFVLNHDSDVKSAKLVIIDECSMIDELLGKDLLSFGTKILVLGDPAQLPPIKGAGFFTNGDPDYMLTEVHRQARDNPIIRMSMEIRAGGRLALGSYGESRVITTADLEQDDVMLADQVIVGMNRTRVTYNNRMRNLLGHKSAVPVKGDKLVCLRNDRQKSIYNGTLWEVENVKNDKKNQPIYHMLLKDIEAEGDRKKGVQVRHEFFDGREADLPWQEKRGTQEFTYGYALTCHKCQGSQWDNVTIFDEGGAFRDDAVRWRYTAITRAAEKLTMVVA